MWNDLKQMAAQRARIVDLFDANADRAAEFSASACDMLLDYSKTSLDDAARTALLNLAEAAHWAERRDAMFSGERINETEGRAVLHTALRNLSGDPVLEDGKDVMPGVLETLARMEAYADEVRNGPITDVVNIGIGGSDLGPAMAVRALSPYHNGPRVHFVSNVDAAHIADTLRPLDAKSTLVIVASKTFTTTETLTNADTVQRWMKNSGVTDLNAHLMGVTAAPEKAKEYGIADTGNSVQATFFDYDLDGDLDLYLMNEPPLGFKADDFY